MPEICFQKIKWVGSKKKNDRRGVDKTKLGQKLIIVEVG